MSIDLPAKSSQGGRSWTGWLSTITSDCIQAWTLSVRCSTRNPCTRHCVKRQRRWKAKNSKNRGNISLYRPTRHNCPSKSPLKKNIPVNLWFAGIFISRLAQANGNMITKLAPLRPSRLSSQCTVPPCRSAIERTSDRPSPTPPDRSLAPGRR